MAKMTLELVRKIQTSLKWPMGDEKTFLAAYQKHDDKTERLLASFHEGKITREEATIECRDNETELYSVVAPNGVADFSY